MDQKTPKKFCPLDQAAKQTLRNHAKSLYSKGGPLQRQQARAKVIAPYLALQGKLQQQFNSLTSWAEVVNFHKKYHSSYDITLINGFLRLYSQQAVQMYSKKVLRPNFEFMLELP